MSKNGSIEIVCGPMFSGKTEELLKRLHRLNYAKINFTLFKPRIDARYSVEKVVSHSRNSMGAVTVDNSLDILQHCEAHPDITTIGIDEIQFLPKDDIFNAVKLCQELKKRGYRIIASGLDMDYSGEPFGIIGNLLSIADKVEKLKAVCFVCGDDAGMSTKLSSDNFDIIDVGADEKYQSMCHRHWLERNKKD